MANYRVYGNGIEEMVEAGSETQAKLKVAFNKGLGGNDVTQFMRNRNIKARRQ